MNQKLMTLLVSLLVVGAAAAVPVSGAMNTGASTDVSTSSASFAANNTTNETANETIAPGERLTGVVGVQNAELEGELETRTFGLKVAKANTDDAKAEVVAEQLNQSQERLESLETKLSELEEARANGSMSTGQYAAHVAEVQAKLNNVERMANETANASEGIPAETLEANGVNATAIQTLQQRAAEMSGPEVAAIAKTIAGSAPAEAGDGPGTRGGDRTTTPTGTETPSGDETTTTTSTTTTTTTSETTNRGGSGSGSGGTGR